MNNQKIPIADQLSKILGWRKINDHIRNNSDYRFWGRSPKVENKLSDSEFKLLCEIIKDVETFGVPDFSQTHSGGEIEFKREYFHWEIRYCRDIGGDSVLNPLYLEDYEDFTPSGYIETLGEIRPDDPLPF